MNFKNVLRLKYLIKDVNVSYLEGFSRHLWIKCLIFNENGVLGAICQCVCVCVCVCVESQRPLH